MKKNYLNHPLSIPKCLILGLFLLFLNGEPAISEMSDNISNVRSWDHGTYYRIVFVLDSPDKASATRKEKATDIIIKFEHSGLNKEKLETVNKKYIKDVSFIQENPLILKLTLQNPNYKTSSMELTNPDRFILDIKENLPKISDKKDTIKQDKVEQPEKKQVAEANKSAPQNVEKKPPTPEKNSEVKDNLIVLSEEKILGKIIPSDASKEFLSALKDMKEEKYEEAYKTFSTIADEKGECSLISEVLSAEALLKMSSDKKENVTLKAIEILHNASGIASDKTLVEKIYYLLGTAYSTIKFYDEAEGYFKILQNNYPYSYYAKTGKLEIAKILSLNNKLDESNNFLYDLNNDNLKGEINKEILLLYFNNYFRMKEYAKASEKFEKAVGISKDSEISEISFDDWYLYAESLYEIKRYTEAKGLFIEVSDKEIGKEKKARSMLRLGDIAFAEGAENDAFNIWAMIPLNYQDTVAAGEAIIRITSVKIKDPDNYEEAIASYAKIISSDVPEIIKNEAISETAKLFLRENQYNKALIFLKGIKAEGNGEIKNTVNMEGEKVFNDGLSFFLQKADKDNTLELYLRYNELSPLNVKDFDSTNILFLAETLTDSAYFTKAREILQALYIGTFNQKLTFNCQYLIALSYLKEKEYDKAVSRFTKIIDTSIKGEGYEKVGLRLAEALYFQKKYDESLNRLLTLKNKNTYSEFLISKNYYSLDDYKNALLHFQKTAELCKESSCEDNLYSKSLFWESYCHYKIGKTADALSVLGSIDDKWKKENIEDVILLKAQILIEQGKGQDALKILETNTDKNSSMAILANNLKEEIDFNAKHGRSLNTLKRKEATLENE